MGRQAIEKTRIENSVTVQRWVDLAKDAILRDGFARVRIPQILELLSISRATFYNHVSSRDEFIAYILAAKIEEISSFAVMLRETNRPYRERYNDAVSAACLSLAGVSSTFLKDLRDVLPDLWQRVDSFRQFAQEELTAFYKEGQDLGLIIGCDPKLLSLADRIMIEGLSNPELVNSQSISLPDMVKHYFDTRALGIFATS